MAKVKSMLSNNTPLLMNDASSTVAGLEIYHESSPRNDFDFSVLLNDSDASSNQQMFDKGTRQENGNNCETDNVAILNSLSGDYHISKKVSSLKTNAELCALDLIQGSVTQGNEYCLKSESRSFNMAPITDRDNRAVCDVFLGGLAENPFQSDKKFQKSDSYLNTDFSLADLLSDIGTNNLSFSSSKSVNSNCDSNLYSKFSAPQENSCRGKMAPTNNVFDEDLEILLDSSNVDSSQPPCSVSLADLAKNHFINNSPTNLDKSSAHDLIFGSENNIPSDRHKILSQDEYATVNSEISFLDTLNLLDTLNDSVKVPATCAKKENKTEPLNSDNKSILFFLPECSENLHNHKLSLLTENDSVDEDLAILLDSGKVNNSECSSLSLSDLANSHFLNNFPDIIDDSVKSSYDSASSYESMSSDCCGSLLSQGKIEDVNVEQSLLDILKINNPKPLGIIKNEKITSESSDDEMVPDIDLSFCVKKRKDKNSKDNTLISSSPESFDSGFNETDFSSLNSTPSFQDFVSDESIYPLEKSLASVLTKPKQSLLSIAISCKPKYDKTKSEQVKNIKKDLLKKYFSPMAFINCTPQIEPHMYKNIEDQSNKCVVMENCRKTV